MIAKIDTPEARAIYGRRLAIVEPVFGNLRSQKRLDRLTLRGKIKINIQWMLYWVVLENSNVAQLASSEYLSVHSQPKEDRYDSDGYPLKAGHLGVGPIR